MTIGGLSKLHHLTFCHDAGSCNLESKLGKSPALRYLFVILIGVVEMHQPRPRISHLPASPVGREDKKTWELTKLEAQ